jgi:biopolymer transport protein ExbD
MKMLERSYLKGNMRNWGLKKQSTLKPKGDGGKRTLMFSLTLTSLIDAFTIIVIYLLVNFGNPNQNLKLNGNIDLPQAVQNDDVGEGTIVSIKDGRYFFDNKEISLANVTRELVQVIQTKSGDQNLVIEADKTTDYQALSPIILAGSQAGFHQFKFAVLQSGGAK